jgi:nitroreductase
MKVYKRTRNPLVFNLLQCLVNIRFFMKKVEHIIDALRTRRAVYPEVFTEEAISQQELKDLLALANFAPTHRLTEPWRFKVLAGEKKIAAGKLLADIYKNQTAAADFKERKYEKKIKRARKSAYLVAICMQRDAEERVPEWEEIASVAMAVQNIWLAGYAQGIGMYWSSPKAAIKSEEMRNFLKLNAQERCLGFLYIGRFPQDLDLQSPRKPFEEKLQWLT